MDSSDHLERIYPHDGWCILIPPNSPHEGSVEGGGGAFDQYSTQTFPRNCSIYGFFFLKMLSLSGVMHDCILGKLTRLARSAQMGGLFVPLLLRFGIIVVVKP